MIVKCALNLPNFIFEIEYSALSTLHLIKSKSILFSKKNINKRI